MPEYQPGLTLITCTGARPKAFDLCLRYVMRQTWRGPMQWIIVDDGPPEQRAKLPEVGIKNIEVTHMFPSPPDQWKPGSNTLARNLRLAIPEVRYDKILFVEDDDWYAPQYCEVMANNLENHEIAGEVRARYYHVPSRRYRVLDNTTHASLCQTGIHATALSMLDAVCKDSHKDFIDVRLWRELKGSQRLYNGNFCVGIKGLPGRPGIGIGHQPDRNPQFWKPDRDLSVLRDWVGADARYYTEFFAK